MRFIYLFTLVFTTMFSNASNIFERAGGDDDKICVLFVCDRNDVDRFRSTYTALRNEGQYTGEVCLIATGGLQEEEECLSFFKDPKNEVVVFCEIEVPEGVKKCARKRRCIQAWIQKLHLFDAYFKKWDFLFYIDCGMKIHGNVNKIIDMREKGAFLAPGDLDIKGHIPRKHTAEFVNNGTKEYDELIHLYGMENVYPRSGVMLYDSSVIKEDTSSVLIDLLNKYPFGNGDQSYISLYFCHINPVWKPLTRIDSDNYYYAFSPRFPNTTYIMHKYHLLPIKCPLCNNNEAQLKW